MKLKYAFNLGRVFTLSLAELFSVFESMKLNFRLVDLYREVLIIEVNEPLPAASLQKRLGGTIKIIQIIDSLGRKKLAGPAAVFKEYFDAKTLKEQYLSVKSGKLQIGVSIYPMARQLPLRGENKRLGLMIKGVLTVAGLSVRVVFPQKDAISLPSVVVTHEHLMEKGAEIDFLVGEERIYAGKTVSVQDFEDYGRRDYQRPVRSMQIGMLPPKVAQEMINLSMPAGTILDPFAGLGTVLQEAMIMGYRAAGADISQKAIDAAEKNLQWIKNRYKLPPGRFELFVSDVKDLEKNLPVSPSGAGGGPAGIYGSVVTEGTLGPAYTEPPGEKEMAKNFKELEKLHLAGFRAIHSLLKPGTRVVAAFPAYRSSGKYIFFPGVDKIEKLGYDTVIPIPEVVLEKYPFLEVTPRKSIIYDRKDQFVSREIFIFKVN